MIDIATTGNMDERIIQDEIGTVQCKYNFLIKYTN